MDLILWRHALAEDDERDAERRLTRAGREQAARVAAWLAARLPSGHRVLASPARRARETADALGVHYEVSKRIAPGAAPEDIAQACGWPSGDGTVVVVGHQPELGRTIALLVSGRAAEWSVEKSGLWWLHARHHHDGAHVLVRAVITPDLVVATSRS